MNLDPINFLHSLATAIAEMNSLNYADEPRQIWICEGDENMSDDTWSILRITGGPAPGFDPQPRISVQVLTMGNNTIPAIRQATAIYNALLDDDHLPRRMWRIDGFTVDEEADGSWTIISVDPLQKPQHIRVDGRDRQTVSFNIDLGFYHTPAA